MKISKGVRWILGILTLILVAGFLVSCGKETTKPQTVTVYVSEDQVFSEPILRDFEKETGIKVKALYDTEEAKSTGVLNRLLAEKNNPQADVYWANEPFRAEILKQQGVAAPYISPQARDIPSMFKDPQGYWTGFSARLRVLIVNKGVKEKPTSILAYIDPKWKGKAVIANPLFGTTTAQVAALFTLWGDARAWDFMEKLKANGVAISTSNGESADFVASGRYAFSLVDSDDAVNRMRQGKPVELVYPDQGPGGMGCLVVPNAAVLIKGAPHPEAAKRLIDYLLSPSTEKKLALAACAQIPLHPGVTPPPELKPLKEVKVMKVDYSRVARKMREIQPFLKDWAGL